jgi:hypothetical protein
MSAYNVVHKNIILFLKNFKYLLVLYLGFHSVAIIVSTFPTKIRITKILGTRLCMERLFPWEGNGSSSRKHTAVP